jgi:hypothetical protein
MMTAAVLVAVAAVTVLLKVSIIINNPPKLVVLAAEDADRTMKILKPKPLLDALLHDALVLKTIQLQQREILAFLLLPRQKKRNNPQK